MKKAMVAIAIIGLTMMSNIAHARNRQVTVCITPLVGATAKMTCSGHFNGKATIVKLYNKGWHFVGGISGGYQFILVFEK